VISVVTDIFYNDEIFCLPCPTSMRMALYSPIVLMCL